MRNNTASPVVTSRRARPRMTLAMLAVVPAFCMTLGFGAPAKAEFISLQGPVGSWQTSLDLPAFGPTSTTVLLSFTSDGIVIETDTPTAGPFFFGSSALGNGHGAWKRTGRNAFQYVYVKEIYAGSGAQGVALGSARSTATVALSSDGRKLDISNVSVVFTAADGTTLATAAGSGSATRITPE